MRGNWMMRTFAAISTVCAVGLMGGCADISRSAGTLQIGVTTPHVAAFSGRLHGGQYPIAGATVQIYEVSTSGYATAAIPLITASSVMNGTGTYPVLTGSDGSFNLTGDLTCPTGAYVYITASGGNPGLTQGTNNTGIVIMAALGSCASLLASPTFIQLNEVTTVAGAWALSQFMSSPSNAGTSSTNVAGLVNAFAAANNIVNFRTGLAPGATLPSGATIPTAEIYSLADILAACVNTAGNTGSSSICGQLFTAATPPDGTAPSDTFTAALEMAQNPANNVSTLFNLAQPTASPFQPQLTTAPTNWLIGVHYTGGGLASPSAVAVDNSGNVWVTNSPASPATGSVSEFSSIGTALSSSSGFTSGSINSPSGLAIDTSGNAWVSNSGNNSVTKITPLGASATNYTGSLNLPSCIAIDGSGDLWIASKGNNTIAEFSSAGSLISTYTGGGLSQPIGITVNYK